MHTKLDLWLRVHLGQTQCPGDCPPLRVTVPGVGLSPTISDPPGLPLPSVLQKPRQLPWATLRVTLLPTSRGTDGVSGCCRLPRLTETTSVRLELEPRALTAPFLAGRAWEGRGLPAASGQAIGPGTGTHPPTSVEGQGEQSGTLLTWHFIITSAEGSCANCQSNYLDVLELISCGSYSPGKKNGISVRYLVAKKPVQRQAACSQKWGVVLAELQTLAF